MNIENKRKRISDLIDSVKMHSDYLKELETIPVLELGVILSKINKLHEEVAVLKHLCELEQGKRVEMQPSELIVTPIKESDQTTDEPKKEDKQENSESESNAEENAQLFAKEETESKALEHMLEASDGVEENISNSIEQEAASEYFAEKKIQNEENTKGDDNSSDPVNEALLDKIIDEAKGVENELNKVESVVDKFEEKNEISSKPDVNEAFTSEDSSIGSHLQKQPISDIMNAIGLNERYLYSNDLFDGDMDEFKNAIKMLNEFQNAEEAKAFFENGLRSTYNWEDDNTLAIALLSLVERRYL